MQFKILKTFAGSQDGRITETFEEGTQRDISDYLAACVPAGCIEPVHSIELDNKAVITEQPKGGRKPRATQ